MDNIRQISQQNKNALHNIIHCRDHQKKRDALKLLERKALDRNPDEFYFNMVKTVRKVNVGVLILS